MDIFREKVMPWWLKWAAVAPHGLILWENEATGSRKVFRYLRDLWDAIF